MDILSNNKFLIINAAGVFLFILKALGFLVGIGYGWLICIIFWQWVVVIAFICMFLGSLGTMFMIALAGDFINDIRR